MADTWQWGAPVSSFSSLPSRLAGQNRGARQSLSSPAGGACLWRSSRLPGARPVGGQGRPRRLLRLGTELTRVACSDQGPSSPAPPPRSSTAPAGGCRGPSSLRHRSGARWLRLGATGDQARRAAASELDGGGPGHVPSLLALLLLLDSPLLCCCHARAHTNDRRAALRPFFFVLSLAQHERQTKLHHRLQILPPMAASLQFLSPTAPKPSQLQP